MVYARPLQRRLEGYNAIFRKPWMKFPLYGAVFAFCGYCGLQMPSRIFRKYDKGDVGVTHQVYTSQYDLVSKFRLFENTPVQDARNELATYLSIYSTEPLTRNEMLDNIMISALKQYDISKMFRVKRRGKDRDPFFWSYGKIHGLENIAFVDPEELKKAEGNPVIIQSLVDKVEAPNIGLTSHEQLVSELQTALANYKNSVE
jgi:hypothetical protein